MGLKRYQHQHQRLLKFDDQRDLLDHYANNDNLLLTIQTQHEEWKSLDRELNTLKQQAQNKSSDLIVAKSCRDTAYSLLDLVPELYDTGGEEFRELVKTLRDFLLNKYGEELKRISSK